MASASTETGYIDPSVGEACALPSPPSRQLPDGRTNGGTAFSDVVRAWSGLVSEAAEFARISALDAFYRARHGAVRNSRRAAETTQQIASRAQRRASDLQRQHPVRVLALVAGTAFLAGITTRIWRSRAL